jgi:hypothetical protein
MILATAVINVAALKGASIYFGRIVPAAIAELNAAAETTKVAAPAVEPKAPAAAKPTKPPIEPKPAAQGGGAAEQKPAGATAPRETKAGPGQATAPPIETRISVEEVADRFKIAITSARGRIVGQFDPKTGNLHILDVHAVPKGQGGGTELYAQILGEASARGQVKSVSGYMAMDNRRAILAAGGDVSKTPRARILQKFGFTEHQYDPGASRAVSRKPDTP